MRLYYEMASIARAWGKTTETTRTWFRRHGLAKKRGGRWVITGDKLMEELPEVFKALVNAENHPRPDRTGQEPTP